MSDRGDGGFLAVEVAVGVGLLLFPVALLVLTVPTWSERQTTARSIAREVGRVVAVSGTCDLDDARNTGTAMARNLGLAPVELDIGLDCGPGERLRRGGDVLASVTVAMPAVEIPGVGPAGAWSWTARHREPVDPYRSFDR